MTLRNFLSGEFVDVIEWLETDSDTMVWRFDRPRSEIKNGAQLIVRPGQVAVFVEQGTVADVFEPGRHELVTANLPVLSRLRGWKYGFESPFKADVVFVSTRQFVSRKWGTKTPVMVRDPELGPVRLRAYGTFATRVSDAESFVQELVGSNASYGIEQITDQLRDLVTARFSELLGERPTPILELAANYKELGTLAAEKVRAELAKMGLELTQLVVESIALPDEVAATLDQRTRIGLIGDVSAYAQLQAADAIRDAARNTGSGGALGVGVAMAGQLMNATAAAMPFPAPRGAGPQASPASSMPSVPSASPPPIPGMHAFHLALNGKAEGPFERAALLERIKGGELTRETLVWRDGMANWLPASQVQELAALFQS